ncbi:MAG: cytochrome c family protein [Polyangiaceae bacterium]|nr:cytochrome c family protein [Polyangiaceae bacterium]
MALGRVEPAQADGARSSRRAATTTGQLAARDSAPSRAVFPPERQTVRFSHRRHGEPAGLACTDCHRAATTSRRAKDLLLPKGTACDRCHHTDHRDPDALATAGASEPQCTTCHTLAGGDPNRVLRQQYPHPNLQFDHSVHANRNIGCGQCHVGAATGRREGRLALPSMRRCADCHFAIGASRGDAPRRCSTCHLSEGGVLRKSFPTGKLSPPRWLGNAAHGADFVRRHHDAAGRNSRFCANCHQERECASCHDGRTRNRNLHPNDWLNLHGRASNQASLRCTNCHREQSFCLACHQRLGLARTTSGRAAAARGRFHPPTSVWIDAPRTRGHHAWAARRNLNSCVGCHVERDCVGCHATAPRGGAGDGIGHRANPHGAGFSHRCRSAIRKNPRSCWVCHDRADPELARCE